MIKIHRSSIKNKRNNSGKNNAFKVYSNNSSNIVLKIRLRSLQVRLNNSVGKIFERLIFNGIFKFFTFNNLISPNQSGFKPGDSCINQLLSISHKIYKLFDDGLEKRCFLDISKAFDKVWHEGLSNLSKTVFLVTYCKFYLIF